MSNLPRNRSERSTSQPEGAPTAVPPPAEQQSASGLKDFAIEFSLNVGTDLGQTTGKMAQTAIVNTFKQAALQQGLTVLDGSAKAAMALPYAVVTVKTVGIGHVVDGYKVYVAVKSDNADGAAKAIFSAALGTLGGGLVGGLGAAIGRSRFGKPGAWAVGTAGSALGAYLGGEAANSIWDNHLQKTPVGEWSTAQVGNLFNIGIRVVPPTPPAATVPSPVPSLTNLPPANLAPASALIRDQQNGELKFVTNQSTSRTLDADVAVGANNYVVQRGDSLWKIAQQNGWDHQALRAANPQIQDPNFIHAGQRINGLAPVTGQDAFQLKTANTLEPAQQGVQDLLDRAALVRQGRVHTGASWQLNYDENKLNLDQKVGAGIDNTASAAATQVLSDGWRPGNGNWARPVFDPSNALVCKPPMTGKPDLLGSLLNTSSAWARTTVPTDPLVIDLNQDGVKLTSMLEDPVLFDIDHDGGSLELSGWVSPEDGLVVLDANGNGRIDHGGELLSQYFAGVDGQAGGEGQVRFSDGFAALASLDSNQDQVFDRQDAAWGQVKIWRDVNHDGKSWLDTNGNGVLDAGEASELHSLEALGISRINLRVQRQSGEVRAGNRVLARGSAMINGWAQEVIAADFLANPHGSSMSALGDGWRVQTQGDGKVAATSTYVSRHASGEVIDVAAKQVNNAVGGAGNDTLRGDVGNNWLVGGAGSDTFEGGDGDDVLLIDADDAARNIHGGAGTDLVQVTGESGVALDLSQSSVEIIHGGRGDDYLIGGGQTSVFMRGGAGHDTLMGGAAADALSGEEGNDVLEGGAGNDVLRGHQGHDVLVGGKGDDLLDGGLGDDVLLAGPGNDVLKGGAGHDVIDGGEGIDVVELQGSYGEYRYFQTAQGLWISDTVAGRDGTDLLRNVERANFRDVGRVELPNPSVATDGQSASVFESPILVKDVLTHNKLGERISTVKVQLFSQAQLLANDIDWQGDALRIRELSDVRGGTARLLTASETYQGADGATHSAEAGDILFTPEPGFDGLMGFKYNVVDAKGYQGVKVIDNFTQQSAEMRATVVLRPPELASDPGLVEQWYLAEASILPVWRDYSGRGIRIGQFEPSGEFSVGKELLDHRHPDLQNNIDPAWRAGVLVDEGADQSQSEAFSDHATLVAGVMVASKNGEGIVGVAYDAKLAAFSLGPMEQGKYSLTVLDKMQQFDVVNHSWGMGTRFDGSFKPVKLGAIAAPYLDAIARGRQGLGTVIVVAGGNKRTEGDNTNYSNLSNTRTVMVVGAINAQADLSTLQQYKQPFSTPGASVLVSAPGSHIASTGFAAQGGNGSVFGQSYAAAQGTSLATPIASGVVALMLEANPKLGYRDVQQILALSARKVADANTQWQNNGAKTWNGGGMHVSHDYGFGAIDARAAVRLAESWMTQQNHDNERLLRQAPHSGALQAAIPDGVEAGARYTLSMPTSGIEIEHVEVHIKLTHARPGDLIIKLISPAGTESILLDRPGKAPGSGDTALGDTQFFDDNTLDHVFTTVRLRGERTEGAWTLQVIDRVTGESGTLHHWSLNAYGAMHEGGDTQYVYTDEYAQLAVTPGRDRLQDPDGGRDTLNAAAVSKASQIDLASGVASLGGTALSITPNTIENAIGGDGADTLMGNVLNNILIGGRGDDTLSGAGGVDFLYGGRGNDNLTGGEGVDLFVIEYETSGQAPGQDVVHDFTLNTDILVLAGFPPAMRQSMQITQQGVDTRLTFTNGQTVLLKNVTASALSSKHFSTQAAGLPPRALLAEGRGLELANDAGLDTLMENAPMVVWGGDGRDKVFGGTQDDVLYGNGGNDQLVGDPNSGSGEGGNDHLLGGEGDDTLLGGPGNDTIRGGPGNDYLQGDAGDDILYVEGDESYNTAAGVRGGAGNDTFVIVEDLSASAPSGLFKNLISDFEHTNTQERISLEQIRAVRSFDDLRFSTATLNGETFLRVWLGQSSSSQFITLRHFTVRDGRPVHHNGTPLTAASFIFAKPDALPPLAREEVRASVFDLAVVGDAGGNTLIGEALRPKPLEGRTGDDIYHVAHVDNTVTELPHGGVDTVRTPLSYTLPANVENLVLTGTAAVNGTGNALNNRLTGNRAANTLDGLGGADDMAGGAGDDVYRVDNSADAVREHADEGVDTVESTVSYTLGAHVEHLTLLGSDANSGAGNDLANHLRGNVGNNTLLGWGGDDRLEGGAGDDVLMGGKGSDTYVFGPGAGQDVVEENDATPGNIDVLTFAEGVRADQIWFGREGNDLAVSLMGRDDRLTVRDWYVGSAHQIERFQSADGKTLLNNQVDALVSAMAAFSPPPPGQSTLPEHHQALQPVIAANWQ